ncbi:DapH/DapD/GlmU-related protein [Vibrio sp. NTOU-M3]|uniref:acyltransferase n=1 Tax=Vibrio sp. NTOU-M3 TaxID=3234954 RepID=UPI00349F403D
MLATRLNHVKIWLKDNPNPTYRRLFLMLKRIRACDIPTPKFYNHFAYAVVKTINNLIGGLTRVLIYTPAFKGRLNTCGHSLYLYGGLPFISGPLAIHMGSQCRISGHTTFSGRTAATQPELIIGDNVGIGWQTTIAVAGKVILGDNVRIGGRAFLFGYSGHSLDPKLRAEGIGDDDGHIGDIILERDVWLGTNVTVRQGVTIGHGTVVAAGSVVTKSLPPMVIAAGNPARVLKELNSNTYDIRHMEG